jgi:drug/metabolite transporter (DMT)-like permease
MNITVFSLILLGVVINSTAQLCLKFGMDQVGHFAFTWIGFRQVFWQVCLNPWILTGLIAFVVSFIIWLLVLSRAEVSIAYPMVSLGYIISAIAAYFFLGEHLTFLRIIGIFVILWGVYLVANSG